MRTLTIVKILTIMSILFICMPLTAQKNKEIRVASYNIRLDRAADGINAWSNRKENVKALIQYHDFDIFGTQEGFHNQLQDLCEMPGYAYFGGGRDDGLNGGEHSAIFYKTNRFSVIESGNFWLSETTDVPAKGWDANYNRICSWVKFKDKNTKKKFYVFNVHFDHRGVVARKESGKLMVQKIKEITNGAPVICTGDFNSTPDTEQILAMQTILNDSYNVSEMPPYGPVGTANGFKFDAPMDKRIDYIFVSKEFSVLKYAVLTDAKEQRYPSDHQQIGRAHV